MAVRCCVFIALAVSVYIVSCAADDTETYSYSEAKSSSSVASSSSYSSSESKTSSTKKRKCIKVKRCPKNEEFSYCTQSLGRAQYCSQYGQTLRYQDDNNPEPCTEGCVCKEDYLRNVNGTCIRAWKCDTNCASTETLKNCPADCASDFCPISDTAAPACVRPDSDDCPQPACKCRFNYRRAVNGSCIPTRDCPPFDCSARPNEEFDPCPPYCPTDDCSQASPSGKCPKRFGRIGIVLECQPKCRCIKGYWRKNGICVPYKECPKSCPRNEEYVPCIQGVCRAMNCSQKGQDVPCPDRAWPKEICDAGCICKEHYLRSENGSCVPEDQCDSPVCPANEEYSTCTQALCRAQNCTQKGKPIACPMIAEGSCITGCVCKQGFLRDDSGTCVAEDECVPEEPTCGENEHLDSCPSDCRADYCPTCEEDNESCPSPSPCPEPECKCNLNYRRDEDNKCIPTDQCPPFSCERPNEVYTPCPPLCPSDECGLPRLKGRCPFRIGIRLICNPKCQCEDGYGRSNGTCVPFEECPDLCPDNEEYNSCTQAVCRPQNCKGRNGPLACAGVDKDSCIRGCVCQKGYYRNDKGVCVTDKECDISVCPPNEEYSKCTQAICRAQNCTQKGKAIACPGIVEGSCIKGCVCQKGFLRVENGTCVPEDECVTGPLCPYPHERLTQEDKPNCPLFNTCRSIVAKFFCDEPDATGCICENGYLRRTDKKSPCIPICDCPEMANAEQCQ